MKLLDYLDVDDLEGDEGWKGKLAGKKRIPVFSSKIIV